MNATSPMTEVEANEAPLPKDEAIVRTEWRPSAEQIEAFKKREIEMCVAAIRRFDANPVNGTLRQDHTLFSFKTWEAAHKEILHNVV
jgi:hypothetical protein